MNLPALCLFDSVTITMIVKDAKNMNHLKFINKPEIEPASGRKNVGVYPLNESG